MKTSPYASSLSDSEWEILRPMVPSIRDKGFGKSHTWSRRAIVDGILYVLKTGCQWRMMPKDLPHWNSCYGYFRQWTRDGTWTRLHDTLHGEVREAAGRDRNPSMGLIDSQSVKTTETAVTEPEPVLTTVTPATNEIATTHVDLPLPKKRSTATAADLTRGSSRRGASVISSSTRSGS